MNFRRLIPLWDNKKVQQTVEEFFVGLTKKEEDGTIDKQENLALRTAQFVHSMFSNAAQANKYQQKVYQQARKLLEKRQYEHYLRTLMHYLASFVLVGMDRWVDNRKLMAEIKENNDITENTQLQTKIRQRDFVLPIWAFQKKESLSASFKRMFKEIWSVAKTTRINETVRPVIQWSSQDFPPEWAMAEAEGGLDDAILNCYKQNCELYEESHFVGWPVLKTIKLVNAVYGLLVLLFISLNQLGEYHYDQHEKICLGFDNWAIIIVYVVSFWKHWCVCCFNKLPTFDLESVTQDGETCMDIIVMSLFMILMQHGETEAKSDKFQNHDEFKNHLYDISHFNTKSYVDNNGRIQWVQRNEEWAALMWKGQKKSQKILCEYFNVFDVWIVLKFCFTNRKMLVALMNTGEYSKAKQFYPSKMNTPDKAMTEIKNECKITLNVDELKKMTQATVDSWNKICENVWVQGHYNLGNWKRLVEEECNKQQPRKVVHQEMKENNDESTEQKGDSDVCTTSESDSSSNSSNGSSSGSSSNSNDNSSSSNNSHSLNQFLTTNTHQYPTASFTKALKTPEQYKLTLNGYFGHLYAGFLNKEKMVKLTVENVKRGQERYYATVAMYLYHDITSNDIDNAAEIIHDAIQLIANQIFTPFQVREEMSAALMVSMYRFATLCVDNVFNRLLHCFHVMRADNGLWQNFLLQARLSEEFKKSWQNKQESFGWDKTMTINKIHHNIGVQIENPKFIHALVEALYSIKCEQNRHVSLSLITIGYIVCWAGCESKISGVLQLQSGSTNRNMHHWTTDTELKDFEKMIVNFCSWKNGWGYKLLVEAPQKMCANAMESWLECVKYDKQRDVLMELNHITNNQKFHENILQDLVAIKMYVLKYYPAIIVSLLKPNNLKNIDSKFNPFLLKKVIVPCVEELTLQQLPSIVRGKDKSKQEYLKFYQMLFIHSLIGSINRRKENVMKIIYHPSSNTLTFMKPYSTSFLYWNKTRLRELARKTSGRDKKFWDNFLKQCENDGIFDKNKNHQTIVEQCTSFLTIDMTDTNNIIQLIQEKMNVQKFLKHSDALNTVTNSSFGRKQSQKQTKIQQVQETLVPGFDQVKTLTEKINKFVQEAKWCSFEKDRKMIDGRMIMLKSRFRLTEQEVKNLQQKQQNEKKIFQQQQQQQQKQKDKETKKNKNKKSKSTNQSKQKSKKKSNVNVVNHHMIGNTGMQRSVMQNSGINGITSTNNSLVNVGVQNSITQNNGMNVIRSANNCILNSGLQNSVTQNSGMGNRYIQRNNMQNRSINMIASSVNGNRNIQNTPLSTVGMVNNLNSKSMNTFNTNRNGNMAMQLKQMSKNEKINTMTNLLLQQQTAHSTNPLQQTITSTIPSMMNGATNILDMMAQSVQTMNSPLQMGAISNNAFNASSMTQNGMGIQSTMPEEAFDANEGQRPFKRRKLNRTQTQQSGMLATDGKWNDNESVNTVYTVSTLPSIN